MLDYEKLTPTEFKQFLEDLRTYPAGITSDSWGHGPLAQLPTDEVHAKLVEDSDLAEYG